MRVAPTLVLKYNIRANWAFWSTQSDLANDLSLTRTDQMEISKRRGDPHRLGFAYQLGFVRAFQRFPVQQPLEICEELLSLVALQTGIDGGLLGDYASWQKTVSRHQIRIREYLGLRSFDPGQERGLEQFLYEESCRLEQTAALLARAREYLKREGTLFPAESVLRRIIGEQRTKARDAIAARVAEELPLEVGETLDKLLEVEAGETVSGLQGIKKNPAKPSAVAMRRLAERLTFDRGDRSARHGPGMAQQELSAGSFSIRPQLFRSPFAQAGAATTLDGAGLLSAAELPRRCRSGCGHVRQAADPDLCACRARSGPASA